MQICMKAQILFCVYTENTINHLTRIYKILCPKIVLGSAGMVLVDTSYSKKVCKNYSWGVVL